MSWLRSLSSSIILSILPSKKAPEIEGTMTKLADVPAPKFFQRRGNYGATAIIYNKNSELRMIDYVMGDECKTEEGFMDNLGSTDRITRDQQMGFPGSSPHQNPFASPTLYSWLQLPMG
ncbi:hypothetical protein C8F04DRAFT_1190188 [Mycena alexandri]|uniref:Uncharacterized protein n=1 Tax=Mycena alexandri TaxID=1745969 RepID=A0AAD6SF63_9AGAR|nr:hypothetical protein C8F04DRAFT_1190188 [Mycena alexandri]